MSVRESSWSPPEQLELPHTGAPRETETDVSAEVRETCLRRIRPVEWTHGGQRKMQQVLAVACLMRGTYCEKCYRMLDYIRR